MGLFKRKRRDEIDLGDQVAVSSERADEYADFALEKVTEEYGQPLPGDISRAMEQAIRIRGPEELDATAATILVSTARFGYATRRYEETFESTVPRVPVLADELEQRLSQKETVPDAIVHVASQLAESRRSDPRAPRSLDAIDGPLGDLRDRIGLKAMKLVATSVLEESGADELPSGVDADTLRSAWQAGFIIRCCETSLPAGLDLGEERQRHVIVNVGAVEEAVGDYMAQHPGENPDAVTRAFLEDPRFHRDRDDLENEDEEGEYMVFALDEMGNLMRPE